MTADILCAYYDREADYLLEPGDLSWTNLYACNGRHIPLPLYEA